MIQERRSNTRLALRLIIAAIVLGLLDPFIPPLLQRLENHRYEETASFRFENSDLFALGPFVSYLREHPRSGARRIAFFGNSVVFCYMLAASDAVPAQFERLEPRTKVFNMAFNGSKFGSSYLIAKAVIDCVDTMFVQLVGTSADPLLPTLIPVVPSDIRAFHLEQQDPLETRLRSFAGRWHLYADNYRLQAALFGTSTREYLFLQKRLLASAFGMQRELSKTSELVSHEAILLRVPYARRAPSEARRNILRHRQPILWQFAELAREHRRHVVFLQIDQPPNSQHDAQVAEFNSAFGPLVEIAIVEIPKTLKFDSQHLTAMGAAEFAHALEIHERAAHISR